MEYSDLNEKEIELISYSIQFGKALCETIQSVYTTHGWFQDKRTAEIYLELREKIIMLGDNYEDETRSSEYGDIVNSVEFDCPENLYAEYCPYGATSLNELKSDWYEIAPTVVNHILEVIPDIEKIIGHSLVKMPAEYVEIVERAYENAKTVNDSKLAYIQAIESPENKSLKSFSVDDLKKEITFDWIDDKKLKTKMEKYIEESFEVFRSNSFLSCTNLLRSVMEALLVYTLKGVRANALIAFFEVFNIETRHNSNHKYIDKWNFAQLVKVALRMGYIQDSQFEKELLSFGSVRNNIHLYWSLFKQQEVGFTDAAFGYYLLKQLNQQLLER